MIVNSAQVTSPPPKSSGEPRLEDAATRKPFTAMKAAPPAKASVAAVARPTTSGTPPPQVPAALVSPTPRPVPTKRPTDSDNTATKIARLTAPTPVAKMASPLNRNLSHEFDAVSQSKNVPEPDSSLVMVPAPSVPKVASVCWTPSQSPSADPCDNETRIDSKDQLFLYNFKGLVWHSMALKHANIFIQNTSWILLIQLRTAEWRSCWPSWTNSSPKFLPWWGRFQPPSNCRRKSKPHRPWRKSNWRLHQEQWTRCFYQIDGHWWDWVYNIVVVLCSELWHHIWSKRISPQSQNCFIHSAHCLRFHLLHLRSSCRQRHAQEHPHQCAWILHLLS